MDFENKDELQWYIYKEKRKSFFSRNQFCSVRVTVVKHNLSPCCLFKRFVKKYQRSHYTSNLAYTHKLRPATDCMLLL